MADTDFFVCCMGCAMHLPSVQKDDKVIHVIQTVDHTTGKTGSLDILCIRDKTVNYDYGDQHDRD